MASHRRAVLLMVASALCPAAGKPKPEPKADDGVFTLYRGASTAVVLKARSQMAAARGLVDAAPGEAVALISDGPVAKGRAAGVTIGPGPRDVATLGNHSFLFVSGMPQSGTSLMEHLLGAAGTTSGLKTCLKATRCHSFNVEGDWMRYVHPLLLLFLPLPLRFEMRTPVTGGLMMSNDSRPFCQERGGRETQKGPLPLTRLSPRLSQVPPHVAHV